MPRKSTPQYLVGIAVLTCIGISTMTGFAYAEVSTADNIGSIVVTNDTASGSSDIAIPNQSTSPGQKATEAWGKVRERGQNYYQQGSDWYKANNTPIQLIPDLKQVNKLDLLFTVLGICILAWVALRFFLGRD